jgi:hypothetical protein
MDNIELLGAIVILALVIMLIIAGLHLFTKEIEVEDKRTQCKSITHPELSVENEQRYNHCISYPETYGIGE